MSEEENIEGSQTTDGGQPKEEQSATGNEQLANTNMQDEIILSAKQAASSAETISEAEQISDISHHSSEIKDMEVHHHPQLHHKKKRFKEYFFEFLMVFLAVIAGFFAENIREHYVEGHREKEYIQSIAEDLKQDVYTLDSIIAVRKKKDIMLDSLMYLLNYPDPSQHGNEIYYYARWAPRTYRFYSHDRTILQLKNSGNWRLIQKKEVSTAIQQYDELVRSLTVYIEQREESLVLIMYSSLDRIFDNRVFNKMVDGMGFVRPVDNPKLLSSDKMIINEFCNQVHFLKNSNLYFISTSSTLLNNARKTLDLLKKEYQLE